MTEKRLSAMDRQPLTEVLAGTWVALQASNLRPKTIHDYREKIDQFVAWFRDTFGRDPLVADYTLQNGQAYVAARLLGSWGRGPVAPSSARDYVGVLKALSTRLLASGDIGSARMAGLAKPIVRPTEVRPKNVRPNVFAKLLGAAAELPRTARRNATILSLLFDVGPRVSELVAMNREDVSLESGYVTVRQPGKNGPTRALPLGRATTRVLRAHLGRTKGTGPLFMGERGERMTPAAVRQVLARLSEKSRVPRAFPHAFRHEASARYSSLGAPGSAKNAVFGWKPSRSDMDANYTFLSTDEVVELHQRYSPLDHFQQSEERSHRAA